MDPEKRRKCVEVAEQETQRCLSPLTSDMELEDLGFVLMGFDHALIQYILSMVDFSLLEQYGYWKCVICFYFIGGYSCGS